MIYSISQCVQDLTMVRRRVRSLHPPSSLSTQVCLMALWVHALLVANGKPSTKSRPSFLLNSPEGTHVQFNLPLSSAAATVMHATALDAQTQIYVQRAWEQQLAQIKAITMDHTGQMSNAPLVNGGHAPTKLLPFKDVVTIILVMEMAVVVQLGNFIQQSF